MVILAALGMAMRTAGRARRANRENMGSFCDLWVRTWGGWEGSGNEEMGLEMREGAGNVENGADKNRRTPRFRQLTPHPHKINTFR